jgi:endoglucanase
MPYSQFSKPADHIPGLNGFKVFYSNFRHMDQGYWGDSLKTDGQNAGFSFLPQMATNIEMPKAYGGWYDAGDWDRHLEHLVAANMMLTMFEVAPTKFYDGQLNIPESGNDLPDLLDEAKFEIDFFLFHMRGPTGGVSGWLETSAHPDNSTNAATDVFKTWYQSAEEPVASFYTSASAAQLAHCFNLINKKDSAQKYLDEAILLYNWAQQESAKHPGELGRSSGYERRMMASAWLYRMTSKSEYLEQFKEDYIRQIAGSKQKTISSIEQEMAILPFLMMKPAESEKAFHTNVLQHYKEYTDSIFLKTASDRACRWASDYNLPVVVGWQATTPQAFSLFMTNHLTGEQKYLDYGITTCDYFLGGNAANLVWVTGIGENALNDIFVIESWKDELEAPIPGIVPYGIIDIDMVGKQWGDAGWWNPLLYYNSCYPHVKDWPVGELEFDSRYAPMIHEFTIWQNMNYLVAAAAFLCSDNIMADIAEPTIPSTLKLEKLSDTSLKLSWKASDDNSSQIASYQIYKDKIMVGETTATEFVFENRLPGEASFFTVRAVDNSGNMSQHSNKCKFN